MYFVFVRHKSDESDNNWGLTLETEIPKDVREHVNNKSTFPNPADWEFRVIKGRTLEVGVQAVVSVGSN